MNFRIRDMEGRCDGVLASNPARLNRIAKFSNEAAKGKPSASVIDTQTYNPFRSPETRNPGGEGLIMQGVVWRAFLVLLQLPCSFAFLCLLGG